MLRVFLKWLKYSLRNRVNNLDYIIQYIVLSYCDRLNDLQQDSLIIALKFVVTFNSIFLFDIIPLFIDSM